MVETPRQTVRRLLIVEAQTKPSELRAPTPTEVKALRKLVRSILDNREKLQVTTGRGSVRGAAQVSRYEPFTAEEIVTLATAFLADGWESRFAPASDDSMLASQVRNPTAFGGFLLMKRA